MTLSAALDRFLTHMEYPATKDDFLREAAREGLDSSDRAQLHELPEQNYNAAWPLRLRLSEQEQQPPLMHA
jgi:hypothetical protein